MAAKLTWFVLCSGILLHFSHFCSGNFDTEEGNGVQPELRIFHHSCALKMDAGPCKAIKERFYFDVDARRCLVFEYGGCRGNANNFESLEECETMCIVRPEKSPCHLDEEPGPCRGLVPRYFYNRSSAACQRFFYGGCFGNANNFRSLGQCQARCHQRAAPEPVAPVIDTAIAEPVESPPAAPEPVAPVIDTAIAEPVESPPEPAAAEQPAVISVRKVSEPSKEALSSADAHPPKLCLSPVDKGSCDDSIRRYLYNPHKKRCQIFHYSGCGGNRNNFSSKRQCMRTCMKDHAERMRVRVKKRNFDIVFRSV